MKRILIILTTVVATTVFSMSNAAAQYNTFSTGNTMAQVTIGLPRSSMGERRILPLSATIEHGISDFGYAGSLGLGGILEYSNYDNTANVVLEAIMNYHCFLSPKFELHAKLGIGYWNELETGAALSHSLFVGTMYFFDDLVALMVEAGYSYVSSFRAGIAINF